jgi:HEAT repeat protein
LLDTLSDKSPEVRAEAIKALSQIGRGGKATEEALQKALNDNNPEVKKEAILAVVKSGKTTKALQGILRDKGEELSVRLAAASRLGGWGDKSGLPLALKVAEGKTFSDGERAMAITALGRIGKKKTILRKIYQDREESDLMRFDARQALQGKEGR